MRFKTYYRINLKFVLFRTPCVYLFLTVLVISYFVSGMKEGDDPVDLKYQIGRTMPIALLIYSLATMVGGMMIG